MSPSFDDTVMVRLFRTDTERLQAIVAAHPGDFESVSHAIRCAIQAFIREKGVMK